MQERALRTRENILQAAATAFQKHGYGATRLQDITDGQDVSKGALYFHFTSKESLAFAIMQKHDALWGDLIEKLRPGFPRAITLLLEFSLQVGAAFKDNALIRAGMRLTLETNLRDPSLPPPFTDWIEKTRSLLVEARDQGDLVPSADPGNAAMLLVASFTGLQHVVMTRGGPLDPAVCVSAMWRCLLPALVPPERVAPLLDSLMPLGEG